ncbi:hypothetical protein [Pectobacterium brasiliense]|uniref:hypothetical protein n=1 Tax=Pectobacterium brasiliense TaxID=180957 RepID=UPI003D9B3B91
MISFGVGSYSFYLNDKAKDKVITVGDFIDELRSVLENIQTLDGLDIYFDNSLERESLTYHSIDDGSRKTNPLMPSFDVSFELSISKRLQESIIKNRVGYYIEEHLPDSFRIHIKYVYHSSVTFIELINSEKKHKPSDAIMMIREYLKSEFNKTNTYISFECIGPSPFHANFYLSAGEIDTPVDVIKNHVLGYDEIEIKYNSNEFSSDVEAFHYVMFGMSHELDYFYMLVDNNNYHRFQWDCLQTNLDELNDLFKNKKGLLGYFDKKTLISNLLLSIWAFNGGKVEKDRSMKYYYVELYNGSYSYLKEYIDKEISKSSEFPIKDTRELVQFYEAKNSKLFEMTITFLTGIVGGVVGSLVTLLSTK